MEETPPSRLDERDPAKSDVGDIREEVDREVEAYARDLHDLVLLVPEDRWAEFLRLSGAQDEGGEAQYRGVTLRRAGVTAVVAQEGF
jgi:hypothetical protein